MNGAKTLLKDGSEALKKTATIKNVIMFTLKTTMGAVLRATIVQVALKLIVMWNNHNDAPSSNPPIVLLELNQAGSGQIRRRWFVYKAPKPSKYSSYQRPII